jgi:ATP-dependent DNA helicase RecQ
MGWVTPSSTDTDLRVAAQQHLTALAGPDALLREDQFDAITALVADRARAVVVQRTGWGKSAVYWIATHLMRARGAGPTLVVSPLLALMRDQVAKAAGSGLRSATINSANLDEWPQIEAALASDEMDVLLISAERLN